MRTSELLEDEICSACGHRNTLYRETGDDLEIVRCANPHCAAEWDAEEERLCGCGSCINDRAGGY